MTMIGGSAGERRAADKAALFCCYLPSSIPKSCGSERAAIARVASAAELSSDEAGVGALNLSSLRSAAT
jgi:hypothetical protein